MKHNPRFFALKFNEDNGLKISLTFEKTESFEMLNTKLKRSSVEGPFLCVVFLRSPKRYAGACFLKRVWFPFSTSVHTYVLNLLLPAIQNQNQEPTPWTKYRK